MKTKKVEKLEPLEIKSLQNDQIVLARYGRAGRHTVEWNEWQNIKLYIQRAPQDNRICVIAIKNVDDSHINWAEYDPRSDHLEINDNVVSIVAEDYYLEFKL